MERDDTSTDIQKNRRLDACVLYMNQSHKATILQEKQHRREEKATNALRKPNLSQK